MTKLFKILFVTLLFSYSSLFSKNLLELNSNNAKVLFTYVSEETKGEISNVTAKISIDSSNVLNSIIEGKLDISNLLHKIVINIVLAQYFLRQNKLLAKRIWRFRIIQQLTHRLAA